MENKDIKKFEIKDGDLEHVSGSGLCNIGGLCSMYECKNCGAHIYTVEDHAFSYGYRHTPQPCSVCDADTSCRTCNFFRGGIKCSK